MQGEEIFGLVEGLGGSFQRDGDPSVNPKRATPRKIPGKTPRQP